MDTTKRFWEGNILDAPRGAYQPIPGRPGWYWCMGSEMVYEVTLGNESQPAFCECASRQKGGRYCRHLIGLECLVNDGEPVTEEEGLQWWKSLTLAEQKTVFL